MLYELTTIIHHRIAECVNEIYQRTVRKLFIILYSVKNTVCILLRTLQYFVVHVYIKCYICFLYMSLIWLTLIKVAHTYCWLYSISVVSLTTGKIACKAKCVTFSRRHALIHQPRMERVDLRLHIQDCDISHQVVLLQTVEYNKKVCQIFSICTIIRLMRR